VARVAIEEHDRSRGLAIAEGEGDVGIARGADRETAGETRPQLAHDAVARSAARSRRSVSGFDCRIGVSTDSPQCRETSSAVQKSAVPEGHPEVAAGAHGRKSDGPPRIRFWDAADPAHRGRGRQCRPISVYEGGGPTLAWRDLDDSPDEFGCRPRPPRCRPHGRCMWRVDGHEHRGRRPGAQRGCGAHRGRLGDDRRSGRPALAVRLPSLHRAARRRRPEPQGDAGAPSRQRRQVRDGLGRQLRRRGAAEEREQRLPAQGRREERLRRRRLRRHDQVDDVGEGDAHAASHGLSRRTCKTKPARLVAALTSSYQGETNPIATYYSVDPR